jgi:sugar/nucleoside kinase (ribokinase family)
MSRQSDPKEGKRPPGTQGGEFHHPLDVDVVGMGTVTLHQAALVPELGGSSRAKLHSQGLETMTAGATAVALIQLARLGVSTAWLGLFGDDPEGEQLQAWLGREGIEVCCTERRTGKRTPFSWGMVTPEGERAFYFFPNVLSDLTPEEVSARIVGCIDTSLHFHTDVATIPLRTVLQAIEVARAADCMVFTDVDTDPIYLVEEVGLGRRKELDAILEKTDVLKTGLPGALRLTGEQDIETACAKLHAEYACRYTAVTAGRRGSWLAYNSDLWHIPALGGPAVDATGAGGSWFGGLSYALLRGMQGSDAGYFAAACAAVTCSRIGTDGIGTLAEVQSVLNGEIADEETPAGGTRSN